MPTMTSPHPTPAPGRNATAPHSHGAANPSPDSPTTTPEALHLYTTPATDSGVMLLPWVASLEPEVTPFLCNGRPCKVRRWSPQQWEKLAECDRPGHAIEGSAGGWYTIGPE